MSEDVKREKVDSKASNRKIANGSVTYSDEVGGNLGVHGDLVGPVDVGARAETANP